MGDSFELTFDYPIPDADWDKIMDIEFENTKSIFFRTKSGKTVEFAKVSEEFEWCTGCKEYDQEKHCCPRWNKVIRNTVGELKLEKPSGTWRHYEGEITCSECGSSFYDEIMDLCGSDVPKFCPHCGADMREDT